MGGEGSGPQKSITTLMKEAKEADQKNLPAYFEKLSEKALQGDKECLFYLIDRHLGKPKSHTELTGTVQLEEPFFIQCFKRYREELERGDYIQIGEGDATIKEENEGKKEG